MESNVLYAVAAPGILKLWPWVNQVRFPSVTDITGFIFSQRELDASHGLLQIAPRGCHAAV